MEHYSLQAIIAVGFKIENERAVQFRKWANRIDEIVHESFKTALGKSVGVRELPPLKESLRHMDTVLEGSGIPQNPEHSHSNSSSASLSDLCALAVKDSSPASHSAILEAADPASAYPNPVFIT